MSKNIPHSLVQCHSDTTVDFSAEGVVPVECLDGLAGEIAIGARLLDIVRKEVDHVHKVGPVCDATARVPQRPQ